MTVLLLALVGGAVALAFPTVPGRPPAHLPRGRAVTVGATVLAGTSAWWLMGGRHVVLVLVVAAVVAALTHRIGRARARLRADRRRDQVLVTCEGIAGDLGAGLPPVSALRRAAGEWGEFAPISTAAELDADVPTALRALAELPGAGELRSVAAAWHVAHRTGAGLGDALTAAVAALREDRRTARTVATELAAARATARMMGVLPALVLLLGVGVGGDPIGFLLGTPFGLGCLVVGLALTYAGVVWLDRIADAVR